jgi:hypothetical protein
MWTMGMVNYAFALGRCWGTHRGTPDRTQVVCGGFSSYPPPGLLADAETFLDLPEILVTVALWESQTSLGNAPVQRAATVICP